VERGVISEVTGGSITGDFGRDAQRSAHYLLTHNLIHIIASDGHTATHNRPPVMAGALKAAARLVGDEAAQVMGVSNPKAILDGAPVTLPTARPPRRGIFHMFGRG
jgi:protein-tyrosine phosphatase